MCKCKRCVVFEGQDAALKLFGEPPIGPGAYRAAAPELFRKATV
jgi:hypothetical protein